MIIYFFIARLASSFTSALLCGRVPGLTGAQKELCTETPDAFIAVGEGHQLGAQECQYQFRGHRWNCTQVWKRHIFGQVMFIGNIRLKLIYFLYYMIYIIFTEQIDLIK